MFNSFYLSADFWSRFFSFCRFLLLAVAGFIVNGKTNKKHTKRLGTEIDGVQCAGKILQFLTFLIFTARVC